MPFSEDGSKCEQQSRKAMTCVDSDSCTGPFIPRQDLHDHFDICFILSKQLFEPFDFAVLEPPPHRLHHPFRLALRRDDLCFVHHSL